MLDRITDGIVVMSADWRFRYVNETAASLLRRPREQLIGTKVLSYFRGTVNPGWPEALQRCASEGEPFTIVDYYPPLKRWFESRGFAQEGNVVVLFRDITARVQSDEALTEYSERMAEAERIANFGVWRVEVATQRTHISEQLREILGGAALLEAIHPDDRDRVLAEFDRAMATLEPFALDLRIVRPDGELRTLYCHGRALAGPDGRPADLVGVTHDITERARAERELGLSHRRMRAIIDHTPSIITVKDRDGRYVMANEEAARVAGLAPEEVVGRPCAEVFPQIADEQLVRDRMALERPEPVFDEALLLVGGRSRTFETVTFALPGESSRPRETCTIATDVTERRELESERRLRQDWAARIGSALREGRVLVYAQPIVEIDSGRESGAELLVRMSVDDAVLAPAQFLPESERYGLIQAIDTFMVSEALSLTGSFAPRVNLSAITLCDPSARREILALLRGRPEAAQAMVFEITETALAEHLDAAERFAAELTELGCGLALDDFGTGFGSFTYLRRLPLRYLKIDRSFVTGLVGCEEDRRVVHSIVSVAEQFGLQAIAEGVEDGDTLHALRELGTRYAQGFHLGRPAPATA